ncbi:MAG: fasciclin domain-containing protein, partial [Nitrososphaeraceae archaeon]
GNQTETVVSTAANETANATETAGNQTETVVSTAANETANATETAGNQTGNPVLDALRNIFGGIMGNN